MVRGNGGINLYHTLLPRGLRVWIVYCVSSYQGLSFLAGSYVSSYQRLSFLAGSYVSSYQGLSFLAGSYVSSYQSLTLSFLAGSYVSSYQGLSFLAGSYVSRGLRSYVSRGLSFLDTRQFKRFFVCSGFSRSISKIFSV
jgi:hypothetical protein